MVYDNWLHLMLVCMFPEVGHFGCLVGAVGSQLHAGKSLGYILQATQDWLISECGCVNDKELEFVSVHVDQSLNGHLQSNRAGELDDNNRRVLCQHIHITHDGAKGDDLVVATESTK